MSTKRNTETRHRWTKAEEARLLEASKPYQSISKATDAVYVQMGMPHRAVYAKLYDLYLHGKATWLEIEREQRSEFSAAFKKALRELARASRVEGVTDVYLEVPRVGPSKAEVVRRAETITIPMERGGE
jgi:hypothetical protein